MIKKCFGSVYFLKFYSDITHLDITWKQLTLI